MNYQIITVSNREPREWYYLTEQFKRSLNGHPYKNIAYLEDDWWRGLNTKPKWLWRAINDGTINSEYIIFTDSWDLVFMAEPEEIMETYGFFGADVVVSAEKNCFPADTKDGFDKFETTSPYKYLNSGFIVGKTESILKCLEAMDLPNLKDDYFDEERNCAVHGNDQWEWQKIFLKQPAHIELDRMQILCQTLHDADMNDFDFIGKRMRNKVTNSYPCVAHFNGSSKDKNEIRNPILQHLKLI